MLTVTGQCCWPEIRQTRALLEQAARIAAKTEAVPVAGSYCEEAEQLYQQWLELNRVCSELAGVMVALKGAAGTAERTRQLEQIAGSLEAAAETWQRLSAYREIWQNWQERERLCQGANLAAERYQHELELALSAYGRLLAQIGRCPVCFGELTEEAVRRALAEYE